MRTMDIATRLMVMVWLAVSACAEAQVVEVAATVETDPVRSAEDAADDPCLWIHPENPAMSTVIGTDKKGGLAVYDLAGKQIQYLPGARPNNVDIRYGFPLGARQVDLVTAGNRADDTIMVFAVDPESRRLESVAEGTLKTGIAVYGSCMYRSAVSGRFYAILNSERGEVEQWELFDNGQGAVSARMVRRFEVGSQTEGCVADDEHGRLYIGEEGKGIWAYGAQPEAGETRRLVDATEAGGHLVADVEGLAIYHAADGEGYLIASSQGNSTFAIYRRKGDNAYVGSFTIVPGSSIDGVTGTDGIDVTSTALGEAFPKGVFVAQDDRNDGGPQNFKLVPWQVIAEAFSPPLLIDVTVSPRQP